jgi:hypothetical protein
MDLRKFAALAAVTLITASAAAQATYTPRQTNASREARIQRTINETYSHRWEVFGGGAYLRFRSGEYTQKNNEVTWNVATHYFLNPKLSIVGDVRGMFGHGKPLRGTDYSTQAPNPQINEYTFTAGPSYRFFAKERVALSAQALGGMALGNFSGASKGLNYQQTGFWQDASRPAFIANVSADINFYPNIAFRISPTYVATMFTSPSGGNVQSNVGINVGVVYRFGHQH